MSCICNLGTFSTSSSRVRDQIPSLDTIWTASCCCCCTRSSIMTDLFRHKMHAACQNYPLLLVHLRTRNIIIVLNLDSECWKCIRDPFVGPAEKLCFCILASHAICISKRKLVCFQIEPNGIVSCIHRSYHQTSNFQFIIASSSLSREFAIVISMHESGFCILHPFIHQKTGPILERKKHFFRSFSNCQNSHLAGKMVEKGEEELWPVFCTFVHYYYSSS